MSPGPVRVLLVEDDPADAVLVERALVRGGLDAQVVRAFGPDTLADALYPPPDVVVCDYELPGGTALDVLDALAGTGLDTPVVVISGAVDEATVVRAVRAGAVDYLLKDRLTRLATAVAAAVADRDLRRRAERLAREERAAAGVLRGLVEHSPAAIGVLDRRGDVLVSNAQFDDLRTRAEVVRGPVPAVEDSHELVCGNRTYLVVDFPVAGVDEDPGCPAHGLICVDVTRQKAVQRRLVETQTALRAEAQDLAGRNERLQEASRLTQDLVASVSHELRTPLTSIRGYTELLGDLLQDHDPRVGDMIAAVQRNSERLLGLIDDLLVLSRLDDSRPAPPARDVDLPHVVRDVVAMMRPVADAAGVELVHRHLPGAPGTGACVRGEADLLDRAVTNLVSNAVKFTSRGGTVHVLDAVRPGGILVSVRDTGIGIEPEDQPRVFDRFFRSPVVRERQIRGTGLGLAVVREVADQHGATVALRSTPGHGTAVRLWVPGCAPVPS